MQSPQKGNITMQIFRQNNLFCNTVHCENLISRLKEHNALKTKSNKHFAPFRIIYYETFHTRLDAIKNEKYWKTAAGRRYLHKILTNGPVVQWIE